MPPRQPYQDVIDDTGPDGSMKVVMRLANVLKAIGRYAPDGASFTDVGRETELGKSTTHRLLAALADAGLVYQDLESKRYRLGSTIALLGASALAQSYASACRRALEEVARVSGDTVFASVVEGSGAVCIARELGSFPIRTLVLNVGDRRPLGVGAGSLALLSAMDDGTVARMLERNRKWLGDYPSYSLDEILADVQATRSNGYALMRGKIVPAIWAIGCAIPDREGRPVCALSISAIAERLSGDRVEAMAKLLRAQAVEVGALLDSLKP